MLLCLLPEEKRWCYFPIRADECKQRTRLSCNRGESLPVILCVTVCKCPEGARLWEEGVNVDETTCRENLAGEEARAAQCGQQSGKAGDWLPHRAPVCIAGRLHIGEFNNISLEFQVETRLTTAF